jgi:hypothetical protein
VRDEPHDARVVELRHDRRLAREALARHAGGDAAHHLHRAELAAQLVAGAEHDPHAAGSDLGGDDEPLSEQRPRLHADTL